MGTGTCRAAASVFPTVICLLAGCVAEPGPGTQIRHPSGYEVSTPNDAWLAGEYEPGMRLERRENAEGEEVLAYLTVQPFGVYLDDEEETREYGSVPAVRDDLEAVLRREIEERADELTWSGDVLHWEEPTLGVLLRFDDVQEQLYDREPAPCFNTAALILLGDELHFVHAAGYESEAEMLTAEIDALLVGLRYAERVLLPPLE